MMPARTFTVRVTVSWRAVYPGFPADLLDEPDVREARAALDRLQHVVEREPRDRDRGQRLHLDTRLGRGRDRRLDGDAVQPYRELDRGVGERQRVGERNQLARLP